MNTDIWIAANGDFGHSFATHLRGLLATTASTVQVADQPTSGTRFGIRAAWRDVRAEFEAFAGSTALPWLPVAVRHPYIRIGPAIVPGVAPCYTCYLTRVRQHGTGDDLEPGLSSDTQLGVGGFPPHQSMLAAGLALLLIREAEAGRAGFLATVDCRTDEVSSWRVTPADNCPGCDR